VRTQRRLYKAGTLQIERQNILEEMDFVFNFYESGWSIRLASLIEYKTENGHPNVPKKEGVLSDQRITLLNHINFVWNAYTGVKMTATVISQVKESLIMKNPVTGVYQRYHYDFETLSDGKTYYCCQETGCNQKFISKKLNFIRHLVRCLKKQAAKAEKNQKKISTNIG